MIPAPSKGDIEVAELRQARGQEPAQPRAEEADVSFDDLVDTVNPLQHIPGVASIYREITGDEISGHAQVAGSTLYGGPIGMLSGAMQAAMTEESGETMVDMVAGAFSGNGSADTSGQGGTRVAGGATDAAVSGRAGATGESAAAESGTAGASQAAATAALPTGISSVLPAPGEAAAARADTAQRADPASATASASTAAGNGDAANGDGDVLKGKQALAAFARDKAGVTNEAAEANAMAASGSTSTDADSARSDSGSVRAASAQQTAATGDFMTLRDSDYNTSAEMRARSDRLQELQAEAVNDVTPRVDANSNVDDDDSDERVPSAGKDQAIDPAGVPNDFASRMKEALSKYRAMHKADE
jgi:hypothetical protein